MSILTSTLHVSDDYCFVVFCNSFEGKAAVVNAFSTPMIIARLFTINTILFCTLKYGTIKHDE